MISQDQINNIVQIIVRNFKPEKIILFGSYAGGQPNEDSDLDLLIIKDSDLPRNKRGIEVRKYLRGIGVPLDLLVYTKEEVNEWKETPMAFVTQILKQGKVIYG